MDIPYMEINISLQSITYCVWIHVTQLLLTRFQIYHILQILNTASVQYDVVTSTA